ncbi:MAG: anaerobic ribonucleoside-triphosphate reductase activating protein [Prevotellaceae bacterium]|nr:anaerobic ribonucleoside-triphosphate reductase activating protein [Candidatus Minthosoma caballi]
MMKVLNISEGTIVDGPGLRTSIYFAGCTHQCLGCHNPQSWDPDGGDEMSEEQLLEIIKYNDFPVTLSGGDPLFQLDEVTSLARRIKNELGKNIWCYTGYKWESIVHKPEYHALLQYIDVLVDSPFILDKRDISLKFRGSSNQRIIDVAASMEKGKIVEINET